MEWKTIVWERKYDKLFTNWCGFNEFNFL